MFAPKGLGQRWALLIGGDLACVIAAMYASIGLTDRSGFVLATLYGREQVAAMMAVLQLGAMYFQDLYTIDRPRTDAWVAASTMMATVKLAIVLGVIVMAVPALAVGRIFLAAYLTSSVTILIAWRFAANSFFFARFNIGVMALGYSECAPALIDEIQRRGHLGYRFLGITTLAGGTVASVPASASLSRRVDSLATLWPRNGVNVLVVLDPVTEPCVVREIVQCRVRGTAVFDFESFYERLTGKLPVLFLRDAWLISAPGFVGSQWHRVLKRVVDIIMSLAIAAVTLPIALVTAIAIKLDSPGPVLYRQDRVGIDGRVLRVCKFRSMRHRSEAERGSIAATAADSRITRVGRILRKHRIDELPQLLNVLRGDMSIVGPRPQHPEWVERLAREVPFYDYRHFIRPGLTGWAQVCYPYGESVDDHRQMLCYDLYYIKNWSLLFDIQIILQTTKVVLFGRGAQ